jgi:hypothetical protein
MNKSHIFGTVSACLFAFCLSTSTSAAVNSYAQDFEGLNAGSPDALGFSGEGYSVYADVWFGDVGTGSLQYNYGPFSAPNGGQAFSAIAIGDGTSPPQGGQYLNIYSDYANADHGNGSGNNVNTSVFREYSINAGDVNGDVWTLTFDALANPDNGISDPNSNATASAFIKTLNPGSGNIYIVTNDVRADTTSVLPNAWTSYSISLDLSDPLLVGQLLQFGFNTTARNFEHSGVFYDNICFNNTGGCPTPGPTDTDNDGLDDTVDADKDGDGIPNAIETTNSLDPLDSADGALDKDGDGWSNADEYRFGSDLDDDTSFPTITSTERPEKIFAGDGGANDSFGTSVSASGDTAVVGMPGDDEEAVNAGAAYVFTRSDGIWSQQQKLTASDAGSNKKFGKSVSLDGETAVIGSYESAYVFVRINGQWSEQQKLSSDGVTGEDFGYSVAVEDDTAVVGAYLDSSDSTQSGSAYVFTRSAEDWTQQQRLVAPVVQSFARFGNSLSISGDSLLVGAYLYASDSDQAGAVFVFDRIAGTWVYDEILKDSSGALDDSFGWSVSLSGDWAVVGSYLDDDNGSQSGSVFVFIRDHGWSLYSKLSIASATASADAGAGDNLGRAVAVSGDRLVIGGANEAAYLFVRSAGAWNEKQTLTAADTTGSDFFGRSLSYSGDTVVIGAYGDDDIGVDSGSVYFIDLDIDDDGLYNTLDPDIDNDGVLNSLDRDPLNEDIGGLSGSGTENFPYQITTLDDLKWLSAASGYWAAGIYLQLTADIDAADTATWNIGDHDDDVNTPDEAMGFSPIGNAADRFGGSFDGAGHVISKLTINRPGFNYVGLFGYVAQGGVITNVGLVDSSLAGYYYVGVLVGYSDGSVASSYATGSVAGEIYVGGLVGRNYDDGSVSSSYATASVEGAVLGGLVGDNKGSVESSYATGRVDGSFRGGGLVGYNHFSVSSSYWNTVSSEKLRGIGENDTNDPEAVVTGHVTGLNNAQMLLKTSFEDFSINAGDPDVALIDRPDWVIIDGFTTPYLWWQDDNNDGVPAYQDADYDGDGVDDVAEVAAGTDPLDSENYPPTSVPATPVITKADYGDGEIYLSVLADRNATSYDASCTDGENTFFGTSNRATITVSGLTNGVPYTCTTTVTNGVVTSAVSESSLAITPDELPTGLPIWLLYEATK